MLEPGQVLSLKIKFNNEGIIANVPHPLLIINVDNTNNTVEVAHLDSIDFNNNRNKIYKALLSSNGIIKNSNPVEKVIDKDSYIQYDTKYIIENFEGLEKARRQIDKLSPVKFEFISKQYESYHESNYIDENKIVYMTKEDILKLNKHLK